MYFSMFSRKCCAKKEVVRLLLTESVMSYSLVDGLPSQMTLILIFTIIKTPYLMSERMRFVVDTPKMYRGHCIIPS
jgi:hypothetical protein